MISYFDVLYDFNNIPFLNVYKTFETGLSLIIIISASL